MRFLITGAPRSGTNYLSNLLTNTEQTVVKGESMFYSMQLENKGLFSAINEWHLFASERKFTWASNCDLMDIVLLVRDHLIPDKCGEHSTIVYSEEAYLACNLFDKIIYVNRNAKECISSMHKLWAKQITDNTPSSLRKLKLFNEKDYPYLRSCTVNSLEYDIINSRDMLCNVNYGKMLSISYTDLIEDPLNMLFFVWYFLFGELLPNDLAENAVNESSVEKFKIKRPEQFSL